MSITDPIERLKQSYRAKEQMLRAGRSPTGPLWTAREDETIRGLYPDYNAVVRALKRRTLVAVRTRAMKLGITKRRYPWTVAEIYRLRRLYPKQTAAQLQVSFPGVRPAQLRQMANLRGITKDRRPLPLTGIPVIDAIRRRAFELNLSMIDVDEMARTGIYFQCSRWRYSGVRLVQVCRAIEALDGEISAAWRPLG